MNIVGVSFSYAQDSMGLRGLQLMDHYLNFSDIIEIDLPICNSNKPDGVVPKEVDIFNDRLLNGEIFIFSIPESMGHYSSAFKNAMDWLVINAIFNAGIGQDYPISNKPMYIITFTPVYSNAGHRHFDMTRHLLSDKMGCNIENMFVKNNGWENILPGNYEFVQKECDIILNTETPKAKNRKLDMVSSVPVWVNQYNKWNNKWRNT